MSEYKEEDKQLVAKVEGISPEFFLRHDPANTLVVLQIKRPSGEVFLNPDASEELRRTALNELGKMLIDQQDQLRVFDEAAKKLSEALGR